MPTGPYQAELQAALRAARVAGHQILQCYQSFEAIPDAPAQISTEADRQSQEIILQALSNEFPDDAFCAEERTPTLAQLTPGGRRLWMVDPIDGTRGFARKNGEFSVMIGFAEEGEAAVGVVFEPIRSRMTFAVRGGGCWRSDGDAPEETCRVSSHKGLSDLTLAMSRSKASAIDREALQPQRVIQTYSSGIKLALVARGEADVYSATYHCFRSWDVCAGHVLVTEAGGRVTDGRGQPILYGPDGRTPVHGVVASNGAIHDAVLDAVRRRRV